MRVNPQQLYSSVSKGHSKIRFKEGAEQHNNEIAEQYGPAKQMSLSGSERSDTISFTGDPKLVTKIAKEALNGSSFANVPAWAKKMGGAGWFDKVITSVNNNETFYEAMTALVLAGILKPLCVLAMPGAETEDKQMSATKNAVSAGIGFIASNLILSPCSKAVNAITESFDSASPTKFIKNADYVKELTSEELLEYTTKNGTVKKLKSTLGDAFKTGYKKCGDLGVSPLKAYLTIALTPYVLKLLFGDKKKKGNDTANSANKMVVMNSIKMQNNQKTSSGEPANQIINTKDMPSFRGLSNSAKKTMFAAGASQPSFTGGGPPIIELVQETPVKKNLFSRALDAYSNTLSKPLAKLMGKAADTGISKKLVWETAKFEKPAARWSDLASIAITFFYVQNTAKSQSIEEERKLPLQINNVMVTAASSTAAFLIDKYTDKPMENLLRGYLKKNNANIYKRVNQSIKKTLTNMLKKLEEGKNVDKVDIERLMRHSDELLSGGTENLSQNFKEAVNALKNDSTVKDAIKNKLISADDITKMAASGYEKIASSTYKNISKAKSLTVFTFTVRFLVTVLMTPIVGQVVALVNKRLGRVKKPKEEKSGLKIGAGTLGFKDFQNLTK